MDTATMTPAPFVRMPVFPEVKAVNEGRREALHLITTNTRDRAGDVVEPTGLGLANYKRNPVVLADHTYSIANVIGKSVALEVKRNKIWARTRFNDEPLGQQAFRLVAAGMLKAWSIGFRPLAGRFHSLKEGKKLKCPTCTKIVREEMRDREKDEYVWIPGYHYLGAELMEYSLVVVPMNQDVVMDAVGRGLLEAKNASVFFRPEDSGEGWGDELLLPGDRMMDDEPLEITRDASVDEEIESGPDEGAEGPDEPADEAAAPDGAEAEPVKESRVDRTEAVAILERAMAARSRGLRIRRVSDGLRR